MHDDLKNEQAVNLYASEAWKLNGFQREVNQLKERTPWHY